MPATFLSSLHRLIHTTLRSALLDGYCRIHPQFKMKELKQRDIEKLATSHRAIRERCWNLDTGLYTISFLSAPGHHVTSAEGSCSPLAYRISGMPANPLSSSCLPHSIVDPKDCIPSLHCLITSSYFSLPPMFHVLPAPVLLLLATCMKPCVILLCDPQTLPQQWLHGKDKKKESIDKDIGQMPKHKKTWFD